MAQERIHDTGHDSSAKFFNQKFKDIIGKFVLEGFVVEKGTEPFKVTVRAGKALLDGVEIIETVDMPNVLQLDSPHPSFRRIDVIALKYNYVETLPPSTASLVVVTGTPAPDPQKPSLAEDELELASILVRPASSDILASDIAIPLKLRSRLYDLVHRGLTTTRPVPMNLNVFTWDTEVDPRDLGLPVKPGDGWTPKSETPPILRMYDPELGWIEKDHWENIRGKPEEFPPAKHDFYGPQHFGRRPLPEDEHTLTNRIHQIMMAIPLAFTF